MVHDALFHLFLPAAETFAMKNKLPWLDDETTHIIHDLENTFKLQSPEACTAVCQEIEMHLSSSLLSTMKKFKDTGREQSATFRYWISFLDAGDTLLKLLRADREADFEMHLTAVLGRPQHRCTKHHSLCCGDALLGGFSSTNVSAHVRRWFRCETLRKDFQLRSYGSGSRTEYQSRG